MVKVKNHIELKSSILHPCCPQQQRIRGCSSCPIPILLQIYFTPANSGARENSRPGSHSPGEVGSPREFLVGAGGNQGIPKKNWSPPECPKYPPWGLLSPTQPPNLSPLLPHPQETRICSRGQRKLWFLFPFKHIFQQIQKENRIIINDNNKEKVLSGRGSEKTAPNILFL